MRSKPSRRRRFLAWMLSSSAFLFKLYSQTYETHSSLAGVDGGHFTLCDRKLFLKDMPRARHDAERPFCVYKWNRSLDNGVLIENRVGRGFDYGRTGNQIRGFFHAFDVARDRGGALVMHEDGFPIETGLRSIFLGVDRTELQNRFGITFADSVEGNRLSRMDIMRQEPLYHFISDNKNFIAGEAIEHRHYVIQELYSMTAREMELYPNASGVAEICSSLHALFGDRGDMLKKLGMANEITQNYTVIHSRSLESLGKKFLRGAHEKFGVDSSASLDYPPDLISSILSPLGKDQNSILMITDGENTNVAARLSADPKIGPVFQTVPKEISTVKGDLMLAILSDVFIGNPVSTFSQYIVQARYALGIGNSYLFYKRDEDGNWETFCNDEECLYGWINLFVSLF